MLLMGALAGDIIGSRLEYSGLKQTDFDLFTSESSFTDDSILTMAVADAILNGLPYQKTIWDYANQHPHADYGGLFREWMASPNPQPYHSFGNGSAMRVSPVGWAFNDLDDVLI
ncbi:MAG: ADP-ribosylglycohydrolase family protein, partial [Anaerolineae bacterium]|nr:ADP-ribosylglycohydrolase family protein [Anaerolineae bacterium]